MSLKLHYVPQTRAGRVRFVLEELGVPFELLRMEAKDTKSPEYLKVNPLGHVPALVDGDTTVIESAAICMYLADKFPEKKLAPPPGTPERAAYYQWIVYAMVTMSRCWWSTASTRCASPRRIAPRRPRSGRRSASRTWPQWWTRT